MIEFFRVRVCSPVYNAPGLWHMLILTLIIGYFALNFGENQGFSGRKKRVSKNRSWNHRAPKRGLLALMVNSALGNPLGSYTRHCLFDFPALEPNKLAFWISFCTIGCKLQISGYSLIAGLDHCDLLCLLIPRKGYALVAPSDNSSDLRWWSFFSFFCSNLYNLFIPLDSAKLMTVMCACASQYSPPLTVLHRPPWFYIHKTRNI